MVDDIVTDVVNCVDIDRRTEKRVSQRFQQLDFVQAVNTADSDISNLPDMTEYLR